jgi:hypothetical protein
MQASHPPEKEPARMSLLKIVCSVPLTAIVVIGFIQLRAQFTDSRNTDL